TDAGRAELSDWLGELLSVPEDEDGGFVNARSEAGILPPQPGIALLSARLATLEKDNARQQADLTRWSERLPRVLLVETEYQLAMRVAQAGWLRGLRGGRVVRTRSGAGSWGRTHQPA